MSPDEKHQRIVSAIAMLASGSTLTDVSSALGVTPQAISHFLLSNCPDEYKEARDLGLTLKLTEQGEKIETASNHFEVSRARESTRFWCWVSERLLPRFASKQEISGPGGGPIVLDSLERARRIAYLNSTIIDVESSTASS